jgi:type III pantothenate kinase
VVDCGTATTVDLVDETGAFRGGAILPGFELAAKSLHHYTAKLPFVPMDELLREPHDPLGTNTRAALRSGLFWGQVGAVRELCGRLGSLLAERAELLLAALAGYFPETLVVLTGGGGELLHAELPGTRLEPHLSLQGLVLTGERGA